MTTTKGRNMAHRGGNSNYIKQNPLSLIGSTKRIVPLATGYHGWDKAVRVTLVSILLLLTWVGVLAWYCILTLVLPVISWVIWGGWTLNRRHHIYRNEELEAIRGKELCD